MTRHNRASVALALKENFEADECIHLQDADAINSTVTGATGDGDFLKARLAEKTLAEAFEARSRKCLETLSDRLPVVDEGVLSLRRGSDLLVIAGSPASGDDVLPRDFANSAATAR